MPDLKKPIAPDHEDVIGWVEIHIEMDGEQSWGIVRPIYKGGVRQKAILDAIHDIAATAQREAGG